MFEVRWVAHSRSSAGLAAAATAALVLLAGCGSDSRVLARVGTRTITVADFDAAAADARAQYPANPDSAKRLLLDDLIQRDLMLCEAERRGLTRDTLLDQIRRNAEDALILNEVTSSLAPRDIPVSDAEIAATYALAATEQHVEMIYAPSAGTARQIAAALRKGEDFHTVAARHNLPGVLPQDGDIGFIPEGTMLEPLDRMLRESALGAIVGPVPLGDDWFIARVVERRAAKPVPLEQQRQSLERQIRQRKQRGVVQRAIEGLRAEYRIRVEPGASQLLFARANGPAGADSTDERAARRQVLARYDDLGREGTYTLADALEDLNHPGERPDFSSTASIERWIESRVTRIALLLEARRRDLDQDPSIAERVQERVNHSVLQSIYEEEVLDKVQVSDDDLREELRRRSPGHAPFDLESMPTQMREQLRSAALEEKREERLREFTNSLRSRFPVAVQQNVLDHVALPPAPGFEPPEG